MGSCNPLVLTLMIVIEAIKTDDSFMSVSPASGYVAGPTPGSVAGCALNSAVGSAPGSVAGPAASFINNFAPDFIIVPALGTVASHIFPMVIDFKTTFFMANKLQHRIIPVLNFI